MRRLRRRARHEVKIVMYDFAYSATLGSISQVKRFVGVVSKGSRRSSNKRQIEKNHMVLKQPRQTLSSGFERSVLRRRSENHTWGLEDWLINAGHRRIVSASWASIHLSDTTLTRPLAVETVTFCATLCILCLLVCVCGRQHFALRNPPKRNFIADAKSSDDKPMG